MSQYLESDLKRIVSVVQKKLKEVRIFNALRSKSSNKKDSLYYRVLVKKRVFIKKPYGKTRVVFTFKYSAGDFDLMEIYRNNKYSFDKTCNDAFLAAKTILQKDGLVDAGVHYNEWIACFENQKVAYKVVSSYFRRNRMANPMNLMNAIKKEAVRQLEYHKKNSEITGSLGLDDVASFFETARAINRVFKIYIGPTNSGKTYEAMNRLAEAESGLYLAPLRLLAHEGRDALQKRGVTTNLLTGEERIERPDATHVSSTIEMCGFSEIVDVAVIDEVQMISDKSRGWAWTNALLGVPAKEVILVGSEDLLHYVEPVLQAMGEKYEVQKFSRKSPLNVTDAQLSVKTLRKGDCLVVFSRKDALRYKEMLSENGVSASVIYGNLSPEVRVAEAQRFIEGETKVLVATDAIGMGLNLPIKRLFFTSLNKYDGEMVRDLKLSEIKQIAGRSGRYGMHESGLVGVLGAGRSDLIKIEKCLSADYPKPNDSRIPVAPHLDHVLLLSDILKTQNLGEILSAFQNRVLQDNEIYKAAELSDMISMTSLTTKAKMSLQDKLIYACVPLSVENTIHSGYLHEWIHNHLHGLENKMPTYDDSSVDGDKLYVLENLMKVLSAYQWLSFRFPECYTERSQSYEQAKKLNAKIEQLLKQNISSRRVRGGWSSLR